MRATKYRPSLITGAVIAALITGAACGLGSSSTPATTGPSATTATPTSAAPTSAAPTSAAPTSAAPTTAAPLILTTPQAAAEHLYNAWKANDKPTALLAASPTAVSTLFAKAWAASTYFFGGCTQATAPSQCQYNWSGGIIGMQIAGNSTTGFRVTDVSFGTAG